MQPSTTRLVQRLVQPVVVFAIGLVLLGAGVAVFPMSEGGGSALVLLGMVAIVTRPFLRAMGARRRGERLRHGEGAAAGAPHVGAWWDPDNGGDGRDWGGGDFGGGGGDGGGGGGG